MLRKATQGAVVLGAATLLALGSASPAMADSNYELNNNDFGIEVLSDICVNVNNVVDIIEILTFNDAECIMNETDVDVVHKGGHKHDKKYKDDYKHDYKDDYKDDHKKDYWND
jgi:hypothetical protein